MENEAFASKEQMLHFPCDISKGLLWSKGFKTIQTVIVYIAIEWLKFSDLFDEKSLHRLD